MTDVPKQIGPEGDAVMLTVGTTEGVNETVRLLLVTLVVPAHVELLTRSQVKISPFTSVEEVKTGEFGPVAVPFTFHVNIGAVPPLTTVAVY